MLFSSDKAAGLGLTGAKAGTLIVLISPSATSEMSQKEKVDHESQ